MLVIQYGRITEFGGGNCRTLDSNSKQKAGHKAFHGIIRSLEVCDKPQKVLKTGIDMIKLAL